MELYTGYIIIPVARSAFLNGTFTCSAPKLWNALSKTVRDSGSLLTFKKNLNFIILV